MHHCSIMVILMVVIFLKTKENWIDKGVLRIADLIDENGNLLQFTAFKENKLV